jgi:two-component system sensor histidine kinase AgrC
MFTMAAFLGIVDISNRDFFLLISLLVFYFLLTISMILIVLHTTKKNFEAQKKVEYLENLNEYTRNLELVYNNLRSFKHDYVNIMTSLTAYIDEKKYEELAVFFHKHILPMQKNLTQKNEALNQLLHVNVLELKSILYTKLLLAIQQDIEVNLDIPDKIDSIHIAPIDLTRILGIYLDNAIDASLETEHPMINFHLGKVGEDIVFIISNTFVDKGLSVAQMYKKDVTTKSDGHGIGLYNVSEILHHYNNIYHETLIENGLFVQKIQIS